jgi:hypothetical protein
VLDIAGIFHAHIPNEQKNRKIGRLLKMGLRRGFPDHFIADKPKQPKGCRGVFIELKRVGGKEPTETQCDVHHKLTMRGYLVLVAYGAEDAIRQLKALGYDLRLY